MSQGYVAGRHRLLLILLWAHVPFLAILGLLADESLAQVAFTSLLLIVFAVAGMLISGMVGASLAVALGLTTASMVLAAYVPDAWVASLHLLVMIGAISLYRMWQPLLAALVAGSLYFFYEASGAGEDALIMAAIQSAFAILLALALASGWRRPAPSSSESANVNRLRMAFEEAPLGMAVLKPSGEFLEVNEALGRLLGYDADEMVGRDIRSVVHGDDMPEVGEAWELMGNSESHSAVAWLRCVTAAGSSLWARVSLSLVLRTEEHAAMVVLQIEDVTRSYHEQRKLEDLLSGRNEYVATVGDEIREPLDDLIELASQDDPDIRRIRGESHRIASIVDDLIASARVGDKTRPAAALPIDAGILVLDVITSAAGNKEVAITVDATDIWADPALTRQVLGGLVANAVRYGGDNVSVKTITSGPDTVIQVIDDGPEIPESERERIFESDLQQGRPRTKPAIVGLGLTVGRRLARQMDGDLNYRRTVDGENVFELRLPSEQFVTGSRRQDVDLPV